MFGVKDLFDPAFFVVVMDADHIDKRPTRDAKQRRRAVHVNGPHVLSPSRESVQSTLPPEMAQPMAQIASIPPPRITTNRITPFAIAAHPGCLFPHEV